MNLEMFASQLADSFLSESIQLLDQSIAETRTISHLLHPPLLDEAGFSSAAKWKVRDYGKGIAPEVLENVRMKGTNSHVGMAEMRERIHELGGQFSIECCASGTAD